jgi:hypothetical protein
MFLHFLLHTYNTKVVYHIFPLTSLIFSLKNVTELTLQLNTGHHQPLSLQKYLAICMVGVITCSFV